MAELDTKARDRLRSSQFAYVDKDGGEHLPINDASHVRNAMARFGQTEFDSAAAKERARKKIVSAAKNTTSRSAMTPTSRIRSARCEPRAPRPGREAVAGKPPDLGDQARPS